MMLACHVTLVMVTLTLVTMPTDAVSCVECKSTFYKVDKACEDPFSNAVTASTCVGAYCKKDVIHLFGDTKETIRGCGNDGWPVGKCSENEVEGIKSKVCICAEDRCNGANQALTRAHYVIMVISLTVARFILH